MKQLLLSIAIPTYNRAKPLEAQLSSLHKQLSQSLFSSSIEVVVVDNCSDDSTQDLIKDYSAKEKEYTFSSYKNTKNIGSDLNFGQAIIRSQGIFSWVLSDDDVLCEGAVDNIYKSLRANQEVGFCFVNYYLGLGESTAINLNNGDVLAKNISEYISSTMFAESMISACIFRQSLLSETILTKVQKGGGYLHMSWVHNILENHHAWVITKPLFTVIHPGVFDSRKNAALREDKIDFYLEAHLDFLKVLSYVQKSSLSLRLRLKIQRLALNENLNQILFHKITTKHWGYKFSAMKLALPIMLRKFYFNPTFWIFHVPLLLLPSSFARIAEPWRWKYLDSRYILGKKIKKIINYLG